MISHRSVGVMWLMSQLKHPCIVTAEDATYSVIDGRISMLHKCNHKEAYMRLVLHALLANSDVVVVAQATNVLTLLVWAYEQRGISKVSARSGA